MTANQVAMAQTRETTRHNEAYEEETNRHNTRVEELEAERNAIQQSQLEWQREYETRVQNWKEEYDSLYLEWQKATTEEKLRLEQEMNNIKAAEQRANEQYQKDQAIHFKEMDRINDAIAKETERSNKERENLERTNQALKDKSIEYQKEQWGTQNQIAWYNANTQRLYNNDWFTIQTSQQQQNYLSYLMNSDRLEWEKKRYEALDKLTADRTKAQDVLDYSNAVRNYFSMGEKILNIAVPFLNMFGGINGSNKTSPLTQWEELFK